MSSSAAAAGQEEAETRRRKSVRRMTSAWTIVCCRRFRGGGQTCLSLRRRWDSRSDRRTTSDFWSNSDGRGDDGDGGDEGSNGDVDAGDDDDDHFCPQVGLPRACREAVDGTAGQTASKGRYLSSSSSSSHPCHSSVAQRSIRHISFSVPRNDLHDGRSSSDSSAA